MNSRVRENLEAKKAAGLQGPLTLISRSHAGSKTFSIVTLSQKLAGKPVERSPAEGTSPVSHSEMSLGCK